MPLHAAATLLQEDGSLHRTATCKQNVGLHRRCSHPWPMTGVPQNPKSLTYKSLIPQAQLPTSNPLSKIGYGRLQTGLYSKSAQKTLKYSPLYPQPQLPTSNLLSNICYARLQTGRCSKSANLLPQHHRDKLRETSFKSHVHDVILVHTLFPITRRTVLIH